MSELDGSNLSALPTAPEPPDRSGWLTFFGIVQIVLGLMAFAMALLIVASRILVGRMSTAPPLPARYLLQSLLQYVAIGVFLIILGIGSVRMRRWARALTVVAAWFWLIFGAITTVVMAVVLPRTLRAQAATAPQPMPESVLLVMSFFMIAIMCVLMVAVPLVFALFYSRPSVKATFERRDPAPRWTDRAPLPVLALSFMLCYGAASYIIMAAFMPVVPFFGTYLAGITARVICVLLVAIALYLAWANFQLRVPAWWATLGLAVLGFASAIVTFLRTDISEMYRRMGMTAETVRPIISSGWARGPVLTGFALGGLAAFLAYLLFIRRYYHRPPELPPIGAQS
jgi:hypothetical protein